MIKTKILDETKTHWRTKLELAQAARTRPSVVRRLLDELLAEGQLTRRQRITGTRGTPAYEYRQEVQP